MIGQKKGDDGNPEDDQISNGSNTESKLTPNSTDNGVQGDHAVTEDDGLTKDIDETQFHDVILEEGHPDHKDGRPCNETCTTNAETSTVTASEKRCLSCKRMCQSCWMPIRTKYNPLPNKPSRWQQFKFGLFCPPHGNAAELFAAAVSFLVFWGVLIAITEEDAIPGGNIFALVVLFVCCVIGGQLVTIIKLPPLLGMLIAGFMLRNVPKINVGKDIDNDWSRVLRSIALTVILLRAGLGLDPTALKKLSCVVIRLAFLPCLAECVTAAIASHLLLGFPWEWGFMLGFVLAAVSPAVVVPSLLSLQDRGYGINKGIPTLVIAAASVDDVLAITGFGVVLGITFSTGDLVWTLFKGPVEALLGVIYGLLLGVIAWYLPHKDHKDFNLFRFIILFMGGMLATFGSQAVELPGAGPLGCLTLAFVAAYRWRSEQDTPGIGPTSEYMSVMWAVFQPLLFGLIGAEVDISQVQASTIGLGVAVLCIGLFIRVIVSFLAVFKSGLTIREMVFIPFAWLPKATVQAAIGSFALDMARKERADDAQMLELGKQVLTIAVLVILITAPVGAALISLTGPRLLTKTDPGGETATSDPETAALTMECQEKKE